jgi:DNA-binding HxlR family transcriptional regulator
MLVECKYYFCYYVGMAKNTKKSIPKQQRRSPCPIACSLDILGDKWTLLIVRDLIFGRSRFKEMALSPEKPPTNILSERLERLVANGIVEKTAASDGTKHLAYKLTEKGVALRPILETVRDWGLNWVPGTAAKIVAR